VITINDLKYTMRLIKKTPVFSLICLLVVAFGVALVLMLYTLVKNVYFQEMPFANGDRFVVIKQAQKESGRENDALPMNGFAFNMILDGTHSFKTLGAFQTSPTIVSSVNNGTGSGSAEMYLAAKIMPNLLAATTVSPIKGRLLAEEDTGSGAEPVVLISYRLWQNYYLGDVDIIGKTARLNANTYTIVGVMPEGYAYPTNYDLWFPLAIPESARMEEPAVYLAAGVLAKNSDLVSATVDVKNTLAQIRLQNPEIYDLLYGSVTIHARHTQDSNNGIPQVLGSMALVIILLVSVNLSSLFLVRANTRMQELAIRNALGSSRLQIVTQVLSESLVLCIAGATAGILITEAFMHLLQNSAARLSTNLTQPPFWRDYSPDESGIGFVVLLTFLIWILSGSFAAFRASGKQLNLILDNGSRGMTDRKGNFTLKIIVAVEVILSFFLLVLCGLNVVFMQEVSTVDYGVNSRNVDTARVDLASSSYEASSSRQRYIVDLTNELRRNPAITDVSISTSFPAQRAIPFAYNLTDRSTRENESLPQADVIWISSNYFDFPEVNLIEGRQFDNTDTQNTPPVVIVDDEFARRSWPDESALGKRLQLDSERDSQWFTVVGVSSPIVQRSAIKAFRNPSVFRYIRQDMPRAFTVGIKNTGRISAAHVFKESADSVDRDIPINNVHSLTELQELNTLESEFFAYLLIVIASVALFLAVVGIYGIISRTIFLSTNEIGIRRAIGSSTGSIISIYLRKGTTYLLVGAVIGGGGALVAFNIIPTGITASLGKDVPFVLGSTFLILGTLIMAASYIPVRRILELEPGEALHYE